MKFIYCGKEYTNEDDLKAFVIESLDDDVLGDFLDDTYEGYSDNLNEWTPSELYQNICGGLDDVREDEDLWDYLCDRSYDYLGFDASDYNGDETTCEIGGIEFDIVFEPGEIEAEEDE